MRALLFDLAPPHRLRIGDAPDPVPRDFEVLVENAAVSLNFGELAFNSRAGGTIHGWDSAGVVSRAAADGTGPRVGARVVTFGWKGAWAERRAVATSDLAVLPDSVELGAAEAVVGVESLRAPVSGVLDTVGGPQLALVLGLLEPDGNVQWIGRASRQPFSLQVAEVEQHGPWRLEQFSVSAPFGPDLESLVELLAAGELDAQIGWRGDWERAPEAAEALLARGVRGKAVLDVTPRSASSAPARSANGRAP